jgi:glycosyltransferase involved in cell wall biosynthesis
MRFHVLGLSHTKTTKGYWACAFTHKVRLICKMLTERGHTVFHYGTDGSDPVCTENVTVLDDATFQATHGAYDWRIDGFNIERDNDAFRVFTENAIAEVGKRIESEDFILATFGWNHKPVCDAFPHNFGVESGIGYPNTWSKYRVFESYAWLHFNLGKEGHCNDPSFYDVVIPNYYDLPDYPFQSKKKDYFFFIGRPTPLKGLEVAADVCKKIGVKLYAAGQGKVPDGIECEHLGVISHEERNRWVGGARALWVPTLYVEPFGSVAIEAQLYGTPVICTDFGAFTETVLHGITGYRCRTFEQFVWAAKNVHLLDPEKIRSWAATNFSLQRAGQLYEEYFQMLADLRTPQGWYSTRGARINLDWLKKTYPS